MKTVLFYTKEICSLCDDAEALLYMFQNEYPFEIEVRDIYSNDLWLEEFQLLIPAIEIDDKQLNCEELNYDTLEQFLKENV